MQIENMQANQVECWNDWYTAHSRWYTSSSLHGSLPLRRFKCTTSPRHSLLGFFFQLRCPSVVIQNSASSVFLLFAFPSTRYIN